MRFKFKCSPIKNVSCKLVADDSASLKNLLNLNFDNFFAEFNFGAFKGIKNWPQGKGRKETGRNEYNSYLKIKAFDSVLFWCLIMPNHVHTWHPYIGFKVLAGLYLNKYSDIPFVKTEQSEQRQILEKMTNLSISYDTVPNGFKDAH